MSGHTTAPGGGYTVEPSPDISEWEGHWWVSRVGEPTMPPRKRVERFISPRRPARMNHSDTPLAR
jgi:hypothetical protein